MKVLRDLAVTWFILGGIIMALATLVCLADGDYHEVPMCLLGVALNFIFARGWYKSF